MFSFSSTSLFSAETVELVEPTSVILENIDWTNQYIASKWDLLNRSVDSFFTNRVSPKKNKSSVFIYSSFHKREGEKIEINYDFQLRIDLPNTTARLKIVIEKEQDELSNVLSDPSVTKKKDAARSGRTIRPKDSRYTAGANFLYSKSKYFVSFVHFGIRLDIPLNPSAKLDLKKDIQTEYVNIGLSQKFLMYRQEGLQEISQVILNKAVSDSLQSDLINSVVWAEENDEFILRNNLVLTKSIGDEKVLSYSIGANARFSPTLYYDSYDTSVSYRQLLYNSWLYGSLTLGADFPKLNHFKDEKFVQVRFDLFFRE